MRFSLQLLASAAACILISGTYAAPVDPEMVGQNTGNAGLAHLVGEATSRTIPLSVGGTELQARKKRSINRGKDERQALKRDTEGGAAGLPSVPGANGIVDQATSPVNQAGTTVTGLTEGVGGAGTAVTGAANTPNTVVSGLTTAVGSAPGSIVGSAGGIGGLGGQGAGAGGAQAGGEKKEGEQED